MSQTNNTVPPPPQEPVQVPETKMETTTAPPPVGGTSQGPIDQADIDDWKNRFNTVLAKPSDHLNSKSHESAASWSSSLFGCFNPIDLCLITCCVPCVTFGKTHHRLRKNGNMEGYEPINTSCLLLCGSNCVGLACIPLAMQRQNVREKYNLQGDCITDLLLSCCCGCCSLIQQDKEAEHHEKLLAQNAQQTGYQATGGMTYPTQ